MREIPLTKDGFEKLCSELEYLRTVRRKEISEKIKVALSFGDLSENSEYDEAKNEQALVERRIVEIENMLKNVKIIDQSDLDTNMVLIGNTVKIKNIENDEVFEYKIVGTNESDPKEGLISNDSPVGSGLLGHEIGETVVIDVPAGRLNFKILSINRSWRMVRPRCFSFIVLVDFQRYFIVDIFSLYPHIWGKDN